MLSSSTDTATGPYCLWGECQYTFKILLQGMSGTGKTQLFQRIIRDEYTRGEHGETLKSQYGVRFLQHNNKNIQMQVWDCAGSENFLPVNPRVKKSDAFVILFDITSRTSFEKVLQIHRCNQNMAGLARSS
jgi:small GTP-binding protein